jgi:type 1 glutamine amidotransferase
LTNVLLVYGGWPGHLPYHGRDYALEILDELGFETHATMDPYIFEDDLSSYDLIIPAWTQAVLTEGLTVAQEDGLLGAVERGAGLVGWHGSTASWQASIRYHHMIGGTFVGHPGDLIPYRVAITDTTHEISHGLDPFDVVSEQYYMHVDPSNHVLAETVFGGETMPWIDGVRMPAAWTRRWGRGRIFYHAIGHSPADLATPQVREMLKRGFAWAARSEVAA